MGCGSSVTPRRSGLSALAGGDGVKAQKKLLDEYMVGAVLGEGAFGRVSVCTKRTTGEQFAVKMIDKVENPVEAIELEVKMLQSLDHTNIVKFHGVFYERCFVCIVMDKYDGGDLVEGLQKHLKEKGNIPCYQTVHTALQMAMGVQHLYLNSVVHRDIKGDNYLMDRTHIEDPKCKIILTDFGTAVYFKANERLHAPVGTKIFWSPEFCKKDYGPKVDVWAMGVVMYGLVTGRFPFKDQQDIIAKEIRIPKRVSNQCEAFIRSMLEKKESRRLDANEVMAHTWLATADAKDSQTPTNSEPDEDNASKADALRLEMVNDGVKERRQILLSRMNQEHEAGTKTNQRHKRGSKHHLQKVFHLNDEMSPGAKFKYEWWPHQKVQDTGLLALEKSAQPIESSEAADLGVFTLMLEEHNIDVSVFGQGKAKTLDQLAAEVVSGACRLMLDAVSYKKLVRVVDVVLFRLMSGPDDGSGGRPRLLIETEECYPDGRKRETVRLPGTKKEPHENAKTTAERILQDMLDVPLSAVTFDLSCTTRFEEETDSPSYPGVRTVYRKEIVEAMVKVGDAVISQKVGLPGFTTWSCKGKDGNTKTFQWFTEDDAKARNIKFNAAGSEVVSALVRAPIGLSEEQLREQLEGAGVNVEMYDKSALYGTKSLKDFSAELIRGEAALVRDAKGDLQRVVDVVMLIIVHPATGDILVQTEYEKKDGSKALLNRLPGAKCRPDENQFLSARRILRRQLDMDENDANILHPARLIEEERPTDAYPGLKTVYRKRLIRAALVLEPTPTIAPEAPTN